MFFWTSAAKVAAKLEAMRSAELRLLEFAGQFGGRSPDSYEMELFDTEIPSHVVPLKKSRTSKDQQHLVIHGVQIKNKEANTSINTTNPAAPLVLLHGYANGGLYFYRNLVGLSQYFHQIYSLDMLGWGLSSRPKFLLKDNSTETAEAFFVESLEAWREARGVEKMILAGHSMGGYMSVAYCEKYPHRVERLILLSPAGVPAETEELRERLKQMKRNSSLAGKTVMALAPTVFESGTTPCSLMRAIPQTTGQGWVQSYVERRLPAISNPEEQTAVADYLYHNATLPGSGEYALNRILTPFTLGRKPTLHRIPHLKIPQVTFLYGDNDWMDSTGGLAVERACQQSPTTSPKVEVYEVQNAGHLLMLDNWAAFNSGVVIGGLGRHALSKDSSPMPRKLVAGTTTTSPAGSSLANTTTTNNMEPPPPQVSVQA
jgi:cardiolipin-specific phospholipase